MFWILVGVMMSLALLFILPPLFRAYPGREAPDPDLNRSVIRRQLEELAADLDAGKLDQATYQAARRDLERELLDSRQDIVDTSRRHSGQWAGVALALLVPALTLAIYHQLGFQRSVPGASVQAQTAGTDDATPHSLEEMAATLAARLEQQPDNIEGWVMLGRSYASMNRFTDAATAYAKAVALDGKDATLLADYADVLTMVNGGAFNETSGDVLRRALALDPKNLKGLWLMGHWQFQLQQYKQAIAYWAQTLAQVPVDGPDAEAIRSQIQLAEEKLGIAGADVSAPQQTENVSVANNTAISIMVELDPALKSRVEPEDTLFIFARAQEGPRMPLAIVRKRAGDLPVSVTLDDSQAMSPAMVLSAFDEVVVGARISKSGQAMPASGDLQGTVEHVKTKVGQQLKIVINEIVP